MVVTVRVHREPGQYDRGPEGRLIRSAASFIMPFTLPTTRRALTVAVKVLGSQRPTYDAILTELPLSTPKPGEVVVRIEAAGFNHRDVSCISNKHPGSTEM